MAVARTLFVGGLVSFLSYCGADMIQNDAEVGLIIARNTRYKKNIDLNGDGRKDIRYENGTIFLQRGNGSYEKVSPFLYEGMPGYISHNRWFYDLNGNMFDLNVPKVKERKESRDTDKSETMLTSTQRGALSWV